MRRAARRDENEKAIVFALEQAGASVHRVDDQDFPDLVVGYKGQTYLLEVIGSEKGKKFKRTGGLSMGQFEWHQKWEGHAEVVWSVLDALRAIGVKKDAAS